MKHNIRLGPPSAEGEYGELKNRMSAHNLRLKLGLPSEEVDAAGNPITQMFIIPRR